MRPIVKAVQPLIAAFLAVSITGSPPQAIAQDTLDFDGVWTSEHRNNERGEVSFELSVIGGLGTLAIEGRRWPGHGNGRCSYVFEMSGPNVEQIVLNAASSSNGECRDRFPFTLERVSADALEFDIADSISVAFGGLDMIQLEGLLRPLREIDRRADIPNLDILGLAPGMARDDIGQSLADLGFALIDRSERQNEDGFTSASEHWSRNPDAERLDTDHISLSYTATREDVDSVERLIAISRVDTPLTPMSVSVFRDALNEKYGLPVSAFENREYLRDGSSVNVAQRVHCPDGPHERLRFTHPTYDRYTPSRATEQFSIYCGAEIKIILVGDPATGSVRDYRMVLYDVDMIWEEFWARWSYGERNQIAQLFEALSALSTERPKL